MGSAVWPTWLPAVTSAARLISIPLRKILSASIRSFSRRYIWSRNQIEAHLLLLNVSKAFWNQSTSDARFRSSLRIAHSALPLRRNAAVWNHFGLRMLRRSSLRFLARFGNAILSDFGLAVGFLHSNFELEACNWCTNIIRALQYSLQLRRFAAVA